VIGGGIGGLATRTICARRGEDPILILDNHDDFVATRAATNSTSTAASCWLWRERVDGRAQDRWTASHAHASPASALTSTD